MALRHILYRCAEDLESSSDGSITELDTSDDEERNLLEGTQYGHIPRLRFEQIENNQDGNCLYESVLHAALDTLPHDHALRGVLAQEDLRSAMGSFLQTQTRKDPKQIRRVARNRAWGTTDELQVISDLYDICIVLHSTADGTWTVVSPSTTTVGRCTDHIVLRNLGRKRTRGVSGTHFVALQRRETKNI